MPKRAARSASPPQQQQQEQKQQHAQEKQYRTANYKLTPIFWPTRMKKQIVEFHGSDGYACLLCMRKAHPFGSSSSPKPKIEQVVEHYKDKHFDKFTLERFIERVVQYQSTWKEETKEEALKWVQHFSEALDVPYNQAEFMETNHGPPPPPPKPPGDPHERHFSLHKRVSSERQAQRQEQRQTERHNDQQHRDDRSQVRQQHRDDRRSATFQRSAQEEESEHDSDAAMMVSSDERSRSRGSNQREVRHLRDKLARYRSRNRALQESLANEREQRNTLQSRIGEAILRGMNPNLCG